MRRALKHGRITVEPARSLDEWRAYFRVYRETLARWGLRPSQGYPWRLFEVMANRGGPDVTLWLGRFDGAIVSGELCMYARRHVVSWHASTLQDYLRSNVAKAQIFRVMVDAHERGYHWFDFNPSAGLCGVRTFKENFGTTALPAPLIYVDSSVKRWARRIASHAGVPYAKLALEPVTGVLARARGVWPVMASIEGAEAARVDAARGEAHGRDAASGRAPGAEAPSASDARARLTGSPSRKRARPSSPPADSALVR